MATYHVSSVLGDNTTGAAWATAYTAVASLPSLNAGDIVYVDSAHSESTNALVTIPGTGSSMTGPTYISVDAQGTDGTDDSYENMVTGGGKIESGNNDVAISDTIAAHGLNIIAAIDVDVIPNTVGESISLYDCTLKHGADDSWRVTMNGYVRFENCTFKSANTAADNNNGLVFNGGYGTAYFINCTWTECDYKDEFIANQTVKGSLYFIGCDLSSYGQTGGVVDLLGDSSIVGENTFVGCSLPTATLTLRETPTTDTAGGRLTLIDCDAGNNDRERTYVSDYWGVMDTWGGANTDREVYRSGGFTPPDMTNPICWRVTTTDLNATYDFPFVLLPMSIWNDTTAAQVTVTVELLVGDATSTAAPDNADIWMRVDYYDSSTSVLLTSEWTKPATYTTTPTALTSSSETWTTTDAEANTAKYKIAHTTSSNVARKGPIQVTMYIADLNGNDAVYIDPMLTLS